MYHSLNSPAFFLRLDHIASATENANHGIM
jgi:hypothetical protein